MHPYRLATGRHWWQKNKKNIYFVEKTETFYEYIHHLLNNLVTRNNSAKNIYNCAVGTLKIDPAHQLQWPTAKKIIIYSYKIISSVAKVVILIMFISLTFEYCNIVLTRVRTYPITFCSCIHFQLYITEMHYAYAIYKPEASCP